MNRFTSILLIVIVFSGFAINNSYALSITGDDDPRNVILISWDGVNRDVLYYLLEQGELPNLRRLIEQGSIVDMRISDHQTDSIAGHAEMLTGYGPSFTNIDSKENVQRLPERYTILERLEVYYGHENINTIFISGKWGTNTLFTDSIQKLDVYDVSDAEVSIIGEKSVRYISEFGNERFFAFIHFAEPDSRGHVFGTESPEYFNSILALDNWLGKIMDELKSQGIEDSTIIYVTTDHGFDGGDHEISPYIFLASNSQNLVRDGKQLDIVPTIFTELGISPCLISISQFAIPYTGRPLTKYGVSCMGVSIISAIILVALGYFYIKKSRLF